MKLVSFNPWKKIMLKTVVSTNDPMIEQYATHLKENGEYFIGVTEADEETPEHMFEELNIVTVDKLSFADILDIVKREIDNEELVELFSEFY